MPEIIFIPASEAEERVSLIARRVLDILAEFNATYPDPDAEAVSSHFDFFTQQYVFQTCASTLSEKLIIKPEQDESPNTIESIAESLADAIKVQFSKGTLPIFSKGKDKVEAS